MSPQPQPWRIIERDLSALCQIRADIGALRERMLVADRTFGVPERGYLLPDEDDEVRRLFVAYRNYRVALFEIIDRHLDFADADDPAAQARDFLLAFGAATCLYSTSHLLVHMYRDSAAIRRKLNEADPRFGIDADLFERIYESLTSLRNLTRLRNAAAMYELKRDDLYQQTAAREPAWEPLFTAIDTDYPLIKQHDCDRLRERVRRGWHEWRRRAARPFSEVSYQLRTLLMDIVGNIWVGARPELPAEHLRALSELLRPGDFLIVRPERKSSTVLIPGWWTHCAFYHGGWEQLQALGATALPNVARAARQLRQESPEPLVTIEALAAGVVLNPLRATLGVDHAVAIRPCLQDADRLAALDDAFGHLGKPYDFELDFTRTDRLVCTEVIYRTLHGKGPIRFHPVRRYGRPTLSADDIVATLVAAADTGEPCCDIVALSKRNLKGGSWRLYTGAQAWRLFRRIHRTQAS